MLQLTRSLSYWGTQRFNDVFKQEICDADPGLLPLQQGLSQSSIAVADDLSVIILNVVDDRDSITVKTSLFYNGIIAGCSCADDPTPLDKNVEHCDAVFIIDKSSAETTVSLID